MRCLNNDALLELVIHVHFPLNIYESLRPISVSPHRADNIQNNQKEKHNTQQTQKYPPAPPLFFNPSTTPKKIKNSNQPTENLQENKSYQFF